MKYSLFVLLTGILLISTNCYKEPPQQPDLTNIFDPQNPESAGDPFGLTANVSQDTVYLTWHDVNIPDLEQYGVYRKTTNETEVQLLGKTADTTWLDDSISPGFSYQYWVIAINKSGKQTSRDHIAPVEVRTTPVFILNNGIRMAFDRTVPFQLKAPSASQMRISNDINFSDGTWQTYSATSTWLLPDVMGWLKVYAQVQYADGTRSEVVSDSIYLDLNSPPMVYIAAGSFNMGSDDSNTDQDEQPQHSVSLDAFWIDKYEVTNTMFAKFLTDGNAQYFRSAMKITQTNTGVFEAGAGYSDHPVVFVTYDAAIAYAAWRGCSLPTEAQWERAARGHNNRMYPWGSQAEYNRFNYWGNGDPYEQNAPALTPVGFFNGLTQSGFKTQDSPSVDGVYDLAGNAWEWCLDWYQPDYYATGPQTNPAGPANGTARVIRGGSWRDEPYYCRTTVRSYRLPFEGRDNVGFRCIRYE
ncbi:SUMF1/EgtB/PvdO family nonheme iron enzyme [candidate division KSB1 bacterium]|nr:SUMF1/EgtB/PvdO family nonheme iron enzyme [candidate division KSB1 bacterium]